MKKLVLTAVVRGFNADGLGEHGQSRWWTGMGQEFADVVTKAGAEAVEVAKAQGGKGGHLTATLSSEVDDVKQPDVVVTGVTDKSLSHFQRHAHKVEGEIIALGEHKK